MICSQFLLEIFFLSNISGAVKLVPLGNIIGWNHPKRSKHVCQIPLSNVGSCAVHYGIFLYAISVELKHSYLSGHDYTVIILRLP
jgi:hypothetical protein